MKTFKYTLGLLKFSDYVFFVIIAGCAILIAIKIGQGRTNNQWIALAVLTGALIVLLCISISTKRLLSESVKTSKRTLEIAEMMRTQWERDTWRMKEIGEIATATTEALAMTATTGEHKKLVRQSVRRLGALFAEHREQYEAYVAEAKDDQADRPVAMPPQSPPMGVQE